MRELGLRRVWPGYLFEIIAPDQADPVLCISEPAFEALVYKRIGVGGTDPRFIVEVESGDADLCLVFERIPATAEVEACLALIEQSAGDDLAWNTLIGLPAGSARRISATRV